MTPTNALGAGRSYGGARLILVQRPVVDRTGEPVTAMLPRLPPDLWFAIAAAVAVLLFGMAEPAGVLVAAYVAMCGYVVFKVFGRD
jgi:hypothetical protein